MTRPTNHTTGVWAEYAAALFLMLKFYRILGLRVRTPVGEIDLLAAKGATLIAVEVKASGAGHATLERIDLHKQQRISRALAYVRTQKRYAHYTDLRLDAISLAGGQIRHIMNAW